MKLEISQQILEKCLNIKFNGNLSTRGRVFFFHAKGCKDRKGEANSHFFFAIFRTRLITENITRKFNHNNNFTPPTYTNLLLPTAVIDIV